MTFTPWLRILESGDATPAQPYAQLSSYFTRYHADWQEPSWRYDRATGEIEYRGLLGVKTTVPATSTNILTCYMTATPNLPKPPLHMHMSISGYGGITEITRIDCNPSSAGHHNLNLEMAGGGTAGVGQWFWLGGVNISCGNHNPVFGPWAGSNATTGQVCFGAYWNYFSGWQDYGGWQGAQMRCTPDYKRFQWRGLIQNTGGLNNSKPSVIDMAHPAPFIGQNHLNLEMINWGWAGGNMMSQRMDCQPNGYGHRLVMIGPKAVTSGYLSLNLDYMTLP